MMSLLILLAFYHPASLWAPKMPPMRSVPLTRDCYLYDVYGNRSTTALPMGARVYLNTGAMGPQWSNVTEPTTGRGGYIQSVCLEHNWDPESFPQIHL